MSTPSIEPEWGKILHDQFRTPAFKALKAFLVEERKAHKVYPKGKDIFTAFDLAPFSKVKVVILGQDPYHGPGQAHGMCFSVSNEVPFPPSLLNIFKELGNDIGMPMPSSGDLTPWARQGVLLLNATLTVRAHQAASHQGKGWEEFTDAAIEALSAQRVGLVFMLWGRSAQDKERLIDHEKHYVLKAPHPSPLSASRGFFGCGHFSEADRILTAQGQTPINWKLP